MSATRLFRVLAIGIRIHFLTASRSRLWILFNLVTPVVYAFVALYLLRAGSGSGHLAQACVGAGLMGIWTSVLFSCGMAIQDMRWSGLLEPTMIAPVPFVVTIVPIAVSSALVGLYAMVATVACGWVFFATPIALGNPVLFGVALVACLISFAMMGLLMASTFVLMRNANAVVNTLDHPIWLLSGMLVPISLLPGWLHPLCWILPSAWGVDLINQEVTSGPLLWPFVGTIGSSSVYLFLSCLALRHVERSARRAGTLALA